MKRLEVRFEYKCYPVWIYGDDGLVEDTALPGELSDATDLNKRFSSLQERFDATYVDTPTEFYNRGFSSREEEDGFKEDLKDAVAELAEKCPRGYIVYVSPGLIDE